MAKLTDPDSLSLKVNGSPTTEEIVISTGAKTLQLRVAGNLDDTSPGKLSGATGRCVYSFLKEEWLNGTDAATLRRFKFPLKMIFEGSFIFVNGWAPADQQTRDLFRDAGFNEQVAASSRACMVTLGDVHADADQAYYTQAAGFTSSTTNFDKTGELNENVNITGNTTYFKTRLRIQGKTFAEYNLLSELGISAITYQAYSFPLSNIVDQKITESDVNIAANTPYTGMTLTYLKGSGFTTWTNSTVYPAGAVVQEATGSPKRWFFTAAGGTSSGTDVQDDTGVTDWVAYDGEYQIGSNYYAFNRIIDANGGTHGEVYNWMQYQLRQAGDINDDYDWGHAANQGTFGTVNGKVAVLLGEFVGDTLKPKPGVNIRNFDANSTNSIIHRDITVDGGGLDSEYVPITSTERPFPFVAAGNLIFSQNLVDQPNAQTYYTMYFEYITSTTGSYTLTLSSGSIGDLTWASTDLDHITTGDYILLSGFSTNPTNNGLYLVNSTGAGTMNITHQAGATLVTETATVTVKENPFESPGAIIVNDNSSTPISGQVTASSIAFDFDYTNNVQGGRAASSPAAIHIVSGALDGAEWAEASGSITQATGLSFTVNANDERNYVNP